MTGPTPPVLARVRRRAGSDLRRAFTNPFASRGPRPLLVHCGHHKSGTVWFRRVLLSVGRHYGLRYRNGGPRPLPPETDLAYYANAGSFERHQLGGRPFRGSHLVRDPRDLVVSGYEYHLVTTEEWATEPSPHYDGKSYQAMLRGLDEEAGLMAEIEWLAAGTAGAMGAWDYHQPEFLELRYEDVLADERSSFERLFRWYGFDDDAVGLGLDAVERFSLSRGGARPAHVRAGAPGEWEGRLGPAHLARFKELTGDLVVRLGYEATADW